MVQLKYFGDDRDFFKYDLITFILQHSSLNNYVFVPMLTEHRDDNEGNKQATHKRGKDSELLRFMRGCSTMSLTHWERWLSRFTDKYLTVEPVDEIFYRDSARATYWEKFISFLGTKKSLIFVDPDIGLEPKTVKKSEREKYLLYHELGQIVAEMDASSVLMIYQHLQRNSKRHDIDIQTKMKQAMATVEDAFASAYKESDLAFLFISKSGARHTEISGLLNQYYEESAVKHRSVHNVAEISGDQNTALRVG